MEEKVKQLAELLKVLANQYRLLILCVLMKEPLSVGKIGKKIGNITQSALSQHLSVLKAHKILDSEKMGQTIIYRIVDHRVEAVLDMLKNQYC